MKEHLEKKQRTTALIATIAINEFFNFSYDYIIGTVLSPKMLGEICQDIYNSGLYVSTIDLSKMYKMF